MYLGEHKYNAALSYVGKHRRSAELKVCRQRTRTAHRLEHFSNEEGKRDLYDKARRCRRQHGGDGRGNHILAPYD